MKTWQVNQHVYHRLNVPSDYIDPKTIIVTPPSTDVELVQSVLKYFTQPSAHHLEYPQKSYAVAVIYAKLIQRYFHEDFYDNLNNPELLYGNDKYFVPYAANHAVYNNIIFEMSRLDLWDFEHSPYDQVQTTVKYFKQELLIDT